MQHQQVDIDALYSESPTGRYYYDRGVNWSAVKALVPGVVAGLVLSFLPGFLHDPGVWKDIANFAWFTGATVGGLAYYLLSSTSGSSVLQADA